MAKRGRYPKSGRNRRHDWIDPFVQQQVTLYGIRLLGKHPLTEAFLAFVLSLLRAKDIERLLRIVNEKRRRKGKDLAAPIENQQKRNALAEEILKALVQRQVLLGERELAEHLRAILSRYVPGTPRCFAAERKLSGIAELLNLSPHETDIVSLLYCYGQYDAFEQLCRECKLPALLKLLSVALVCPMRELRRLLAHKERLLTSGVVRDIDPDRSPAIRLNDEVAAHLAGIADIPLAERYCTKVTGRTLDVKRFNMCPRSIGIAQELLSRHGQCHLLLHGAPGTGKTEFAKSIISSTGKQPFFVQHGDSRGFGGESCSDRKMALQVALACVPRDTGILVVDEADDLLNTRTYMFGLAKAIDKGWLNMFMDRCDRQIIWITNDTTYMEESTQRRFAYSIDFKPFTRHEREDIWKVLLRRHPLRKHIPVTVVRDLAGRYPVNAAGIASALDTLKTVVTGASDDSAVQSTLNELLDRHLHATGKRKTKRLNTITAHYDVGALNVDIHPSRIVRALQAFQGDRRDQRTRDGGGNQICSTCGWAARNPTSGRHSTRLCGTGPSCSWTRPIPSSSTAKLQSNHGRRAKPMNC